MPANHLDASQFTQDMQFDTDIVIIGSGAGGGIAAEQLARHQLKAPFNGVISARWTDLGQWLTPGDQVFTLVSTDELRLDVQLPQEHLPSIDQIHAVQIRPDSQPTLHIPARVDAIVPVGDASRSFLLRLVATDSSPALMPGAWFGAEKTVRRKFFSRRSET